VLQQLQPEFKQEKVSEIDEIQKIELDDLDILEAKRQKYYKVKQREWLGNIRKLSQSRIYTAEQLYTAFCMIFPPDDGQKHTPDEVVKAFEQREEEWYVKVVKRLCCYFTGDKRFNSASFNLEKGLLIYGGVGVGKSTLLETFRRNQIFSYRIASCRDIENQFADIGVDTVGYYSKNHDMPTNIYNQSEAGFCFDDLGTENAVTKYFGNSKNIMAEIILNRYDKKLDSRSTHITTNITYNQIVELYGDRVIDRMKESFNFIEFPKDAKSRR
jgi:DNA replication protein DnaC